VIQPITVDFETLGIEGRPKYPPLPVSVAILRPGKKPEWYAWGHPTKNNCDRAKAQRVLADIWKSRVPLLFHNANFDLDVAETHLGLRMPSWDRIHDTLLILFLLDPHAPDYHLKPTAERLLGMKPEERDAIREWLIAHGVVPSNASDDKFGANISKAPGDLVGKYAIGDVVRTKKLFDKLYPRLLADESEGQTMSDAYDRERKLLPILLDCERRGLRFDVQRAEKDLPKLEKALLDSEGWLRKRLKIKDSEYESTKGKGFNFDAPAHIGRALKKAKIVTEFTKTASGKDSVSKKNLTIDKYGDVEVFHRLGYRNRLETVLSLNLRPWFADARVNDGLIYTRWTQTRRDGAGARTGRVTCSKFANVPKAFDDKGDGWLQPQDMPSVPLVRSYLLPDPGQVWGHLDYSQQEFRIIAHYAEGEVLKAYLENPRTDFHDLMQKNLKEMAGLDLKRRLVKIVNFSIKYGTGGPALAALLGLGVETAKSIIKGVKLATPSVNALNRELMDRGKEGVPIRTWGGRLYYCEPPRFVEKYGREMSFEYKLLSYLIQGSGADCMKEAIIRYHDAKPEARMLTTVYDEMNVSCSKRGYKGELRKLREAMESIEFDVPMLTDAEFGPSWGDLQALDSKEKAA
jgi:DNA polymerase I-like protein with 3'-5' exonuclease and polymerase domains